jgi:polyisoprenoid-binding protein YceI
LHLCIINVKSKPMVLEKAKWIFEPAHCKIGFSVRHFGISESE